MKPKLIICSAIAATLMATSSYGDELRDLAEAYMALDANQLMIDSMFSAETFAAQFATTMPAEYTTDDAKLLEAGQVMSDAMNALLPEIEEAILESTIKHFTLDELQLLYDLYSSEHGISIAQKMSVYFVDAMADLNPVIMDVSIQATPQILEILSPE